MLTYFAGRPARKVPAPMGLHDVTLDDKYDLSKKRSLMSGVQAMVRLTMMQHERDRQAGHNTAGYVTGYRGSPLGGLDQAMWRADDHLRRHNVHCRPAINEDLGATAVWGTQQVNLFEGARYDGVYAMWYGKGPGLDQSLDAMRQANYHGSAKHGGVLVLAGDDPAMRSTVDPYHSELLFEDLLMPVLYPADIQEVFDLALFGFELPLSR